MPDRKLYFGFNWVVYTLASICTPDQFPLTVKGQRSVIEGTLKHPRVKANLCINSYVARLWQREAPEMIDMVKEGVRRGQFEITSFTHDENILSDLPYDEIVRQVKLNVETQEEVFGVRPRGANNPEMSWDPVTGKVFLDCGLEWVAISNWQLFKLAHPAPSSKADLYRSAYLHTIEDARIPAVFTSLEPGSWRAGDDLPAPGLKLASYWAGRIDESHIGPALASMQEINDRGDLFILHAEDSEDFWRAPYFHQTGLTQEQMEARFDRALCILESTPFVEFATVSEYLAQHPAERTHYVRPSVGFFDRDGFGIWERGMFNQAYNLNLQCDRAREEIHHAELMIELAEKLGGDAGRARELVRQAWEKYGLSRTASGRGYGTTEAFTVWSSDLAVGAFKLAREAISAVELRNARRLP